MYNKSKIPYTPVKLQLFTLVIIKYTLYTMTHLLRIYCCFRPGTNRSIFSTFENISFVPQIYKAVVNFRFLASILKNAVSSQSSSFARNKEINIESISLQDRCLDSST